MTLRPAPLLEQPIVVHYLEGLRTLGFKLLGNMVDTRIYVVQAAGAEYPTSVREWELY
jgi:hypothetical protein